ncbi:MAG: hypothetical protein RLZZ301_1551 [Bacteroidota bacterium]
MSSALFAQKPASDDAKWSLEGLANLNTTDGMSWSAPTLRLRYFATDNIAGRFQLGFGDGTPTPSKESHTFLSNPNDATAASGTQDISRSAWNASFGAEYHLAGTDKMSPFFSAQVGLGKGSYEETWKNFDGTSYNANVSSATINGGYSTFSMGLGAGFDYYVADNLYLGLEMSLTSSSVKNNDGVGVVTTPLGEQTTTNPGSTLKYVNLGAAHGSVRIGWRF